MLFPVLAFIILLLTPAPNQAADAPAHGGVLTGTVLETMNGAGYTYVHLETADATIWVALPESSVETGKTVSLLPGMVMQDFHSNAFDRTFDSIVFSPGLADNQTAGAPGAQANKEGGNAFAAAVAAERGAVQQQIPPQSGGSQAAIVPFSETSVEKAQGEHAYTVAELYAKAKELDGSVVRVRGQVVKFNTNIMGRNWVHVQDGSGDPVNNTHDLVITTSQEVTLQQVVTLEGTVAAAKDFGAGYAYEVLLEQATIVE
jgi:hypothetical protein